jgi:hypothetical protein
MLRPLFRALYKPSQRLLVLYHGPAVELLGVRLPHDHVHEVFVSTESVAVAHESKQLGSLLDFDGGRKHITIAVLSLTGDEEVTGNLVVLDPDMDRAHHLPFVDWAILLVQGTEMPRRFHTFRRNIPETTSIRKAYVGVSDSQEARADFTNQEVWATA